MVRHIKSAIMDNVKNVAIDVENPQERCQQAPALEKAPIPLWAKLAGGAVAFSAMIYGTSMMSSAMVLTELKKQVVTSSTSSNVVAKSRGNSESHSRSRSSRTGKGSRSTGKKTGPPKPLKEHSKPWSNPYAKLDKSWGKKLQCEWQEAKHKELYPNECREVRIICDDKSEKHECNVYKKHLCILCLIGDGISYFEAGDYTVKLKKCDEHVVHVACYNAWFKYYDKLPDDVWKERTKKNGSVSYLKPGASKWQPTGPIEPKKVWIERTKKGDISYWNPGKSKWQPTRPWKCPCKYIKPGWKISVMGAQGWELFFYVCFVTMILCFSVALLLSYGRY